MDFMFREFKQYELFDEGEQVDTANVWLGNQATINLLSSANVHKVMSRKERRDLKVTLNWEDPVPAPIAKASRLAPSP